MKQNYWEFLEPFSTQPVIVSHSVVKVIFDYQRNLSDDVMKGIAASGGVGWGDGPRGITGPAYSS